jgi:uncharacterized protein YegL
MPRLDKDLEIQKIAGSNFSFSGTRLDHLGASGYTLVTVAVDVTGSVSGFEQELHAMLVAAVESCKKSPLKDNILVRVVLFSTRFKQGISEIHGFKPVLEIDTASYPALIAGGLTPLCDAVFSSIGATNTYGAQLRGRHYDANGICFIITDGDDNDSVASMDMVKREAEKSVTGEILESMISILIGVNASNLRHLLTRFKDEAGITQYVDAGDATPQRLAKLADFVSQSVSSQAQAQGTGGPSQSIAATI